MMKIALKSVNLNPLSIDLISESAAGEDEIVARFGAEVADMHAHIDAARLAVPYVGDEFIYANESFDIGEQKFYDFDLFGA